jgi:hypothetical protein
MWEGGPEEREGVKVGVAWGIKGPGYLSPPSRRRPLTSISGFFLSLLFAFFPVCLEGWE